MLEILNYLRTRYMSEKAQGMVEYALILAFVVALAFVLTNDGGLKTAITNVFTSATNQINSQLSSGK
ncbi:Flp family type IVb pilin [Selenomonas montiformis]|uniref:Flp family type IVb pilin n=1 Tax=Selenomonas montiformis TaxID=2652285 RepID=UPI003F89183E